MTRALKWRIAIGLLLVFVAGAATGVFAGAWHARSVVQGAPRRDDGRAHARTHHAASRPHARATARQVDPILDRAAAELHAIRAETGQRVAETMRRSHQEIAPHLDAGATGEARDNEDAAYAHLEVHAGRHHRPPAALRKRTPLERRALALVGTTAANVRHVGTKEAHREIERKFLVRQMPENLSQYPHVEIAQGYLAIAPEWRAGAAAESRAKSTRSLIRGTTAAAAKNARSS